MKTSYDDILYGIINEPRSMFIQLINEKVIINRMTNYCCE